METISLPQCEKRKPYVTYDALCGSYRYTKKSVFTKKHIGLVSFVYSLELFVEESNKEISMTTEGVRVA